MTAKFAIFCISVFTVLAFVSSYAGEYIPKSYYIISDGHRSDTVYLRSKRSVLHLLRKRREASPPSQDIPFAGAIPSPEHFFSQAQEFLNKLPHGDFQFPGAFNSAGSQGSQGYGSGSGAGAYSYSSASGSGGAKGTGQGTNHHYSNAGPGPQVQSRFGEEKGNGIHVSGSASGPNGAFSSSSATSDGNGNVRYSVKTGKY